MAIDDKIRLTRNQLAEFIDTHDTIRQFERLIQIVNLLVIAVDDLEDRVTVLEP